jgi:SET domain
VNLPYLNDQITSDNDGICASGWLRVMSSDLVLVSLITLKYVTWRQRVSHWEISLGKDEKGNSLMHSAIYDHLSRVNHSCLPNASHSFSVVSFSGQLRAVHDIKKGEEIFVTYCDIDVPTAARQKSLEPYGFRCTCSSCKDPQSDYRRQAIVDSGKGNLDGGYRQMSSRAEEMRRLEDGLRWLGRIEAEGLQKLDVYGRHMEAVVRLEYQTHLRIIPIHFKLLHTVYTSGTFACIHYVFVRGVSAQYKHDRSPLSWSL